MRQKYNYCIHICHIYKQNTPEMYTRYAPVGMCVK